MQIMIFGGTTEGRQLSYALAAQGAAVTVSVATAYGAEEQGEAAGIRVLTGRMDGFAMAQALAGQELCIDATHPYAVEVSATLREACRAAGVPYIRLLREESGLAEGAVYVDGAAQAAAFLQETTGNILLTTGTKELPAFRRLERERLYPRILPMAENLQVCEEENIPRRNIIAMQGPFGQALNEALMEQFAIRYLVTKDGGKVGGFSEKIAAAKKKGVAVVILRRPEEDGMTYEEILEKWKEMAGCR